MSCAAQKSSIDEAARSSGGPRGTGRWLVSRMVVLLGAHIGARGHNSSDWGIISCPKSKLAARNQTGFFDFGTSFFDFGTGVDFAYLRYLGSLSTGLTT